MLILCVETHNYMHCGFPVLHYQECCPLNNVVTAGAVSDKEGQMNSGDHCVTDREVL